MGELKEELGGIVYAQKTGTAPENAEAEITRIVGELTAADAELTADAADASDDGASDDAGEAAAG